MDTIKHEFETILITMLASIAALFFLYQYNYNNGFNVSVALPDVINFLPTPTPTPTPVPTTDYASQISSDGKLKITMKSVTDSGRIRDYSFSVSSMEEGAGPLPVFYESVNNNVEFFIPFNTISAGNKYLFLQEINKGKSSFLVFATSGEAYNENQKYLNVSSLFGEYNSGYNLFNVTGWEAGPLLIIQTKADDGSWGPSFWLDVTNRSFYRLSTKF